MIVVDVTQLGTADYPPGAVFTRSVLTDWELVWVLSGSARWTRAHHEIVTKPGDLLLIGPGPADRLYWDQRQSTRHGYVHFRLPESQPPTLIPGGSARVWTMTGSDLPAALCRYLVDLAALPDARARERARQVVGLLVDVLVVGPLPGRAVTEPPLTIDAAARHVGRAWAAHGVDGIELGELADALSLSRRHLCRLFAVHLGIGPVKAFELLRLARVATLLARSNLTLAAIATACGYASPFHLSRRFSAEYDMSPRQYRQHSADGTTLVDPVMSRGLQALSYVVAEAEHAS